MRLEITPATDKAIAIPSTGLRHHIRRLTRPMSCIRWQDVILLQGTPLFGALFSIGKLTAGKSAALVLLLASSCCLVAHVFAFNDWSGIDGDVRDPHRASSVFLSRGIRRIEIGFLSIMLMVFGLLLLIPLGIRSLAVGLGIIVLAALYSAPGLHFKGVPLVSSALHLAGGLLHFLLGYSLFRAIDMRGLEIGAFFALTFVAGHLTQEVRDWEGDRLNGIKTNAVRFGRRIVFIASFALFTMAYALLAILADRNIVPHPIIWIAAVYPLQLYGTVRTLYAGLNFKSVCKTQAHYRASYAIIGVIIVIALLPSIKP